MIRTSMQRWSVLVLVGALGACATSGTRGTTGTTTESGGAIADTSRGAVADTSRGALADTSSHARMDTTGANVGANADTSGRAMADTSGHAMADTSHAGAGAGPAWTAQIQPVGQNSIAGTAMGKISGNATSVTIQISGARDGQEERWMIWEGSCTRRLAPVGTTNDYPIIRATSGGSGTATANLSTTLDPKKSYVVVVIPSPATEAGAESACGNVQMM
ncbi:MAG TPA: hypothetical protein VFS05_09875 [Gemmatimonadaceae bacterium]|nr:hypothetical protein [Gemmatimonadaceae bacterium]